MTSFQTGITPSKRAAARFIGAVRRGLQMVLSEEDVSQSDLARELDVHRSVISREIRGDKDLGLGRVGELAFLLGRRAEVSFPRRKIAEGANNQPETNIRLEIKVGSSSAVPTKREAELAPGNFTIVSKAASITSKAA